MFSDEAEVREDVEQIAGSSQVVSLAVVWFVGISARREAARRTKDRAKFVAFMRALFDRVSTGGATVREAGRVAGFETQRARELLAMFLRDAVPEVFALGGVDAECMSALADLIETYGEEIGLGGETVLASVGEAEDDGGGGG